MSKLELKDITMEDLPVVSKPWYKSKTIWFNILTIGGAIAGGAVGLMPTLQPLLTVQGYALAMFFVGFVNIVLRALTSLAIDNVSTN